MARDRYGSGSVLLIVFSGLPGTGKTTLARALARRLGATYLRIDSIEQAIVDSAIGGRSAEDAGYRVGYALAEDNLRIGRTVVADSVNPVPQTRSAWLRAAANAVCKSIDIEVVCTDVEQHRERVEGREPDISGLRLPTWRDVSNREYHAWTCDRIVIDTAGKSVEQCTDEIVARLPLSSPRDSD